MRRLIPFLALTLVVVATWWAGGLGPLERYLTDVRFRLVEREAQGGVVVVGIDPRSLEQLDVWPWARGYHATTLENLLAAGATRVAFDVDFSSRSDDAGEDRDLARALAAAGPRVVLPLFRQYQRDGRGGRRLVETGPLPMFREHARLGTINVRPDPGGLARRYAAFDEDGGTRVPSLALALQDLADPPSRPFHLDFGIDVDTIPVLSYVDVLTGQFDPAVVRGRAVIVGATAVELGDYVAVPLQSTIPGPLLQALAFESLQQGRALQRPAALPTLLLTLGIALAGWWLLRSSSWRAGLLVTATLVTSVLLLAVVVQTRAPLLLDVAPALLLVLGGFVLNVALRVDQQGLRLLLQSIRMRQTEGMMRLVVDHSFDAIVTVDSQGGIETVNPAAESMFGRSREELAGRPITELVSAPEPGEAVGRRRSGDGFPVEVTVSALADRRDPRRVYFLRDITERKAHEQALERQATYDGLTALPNRLLLRRRLEQALRAARADGLPVAFMILDLDRFKEVNDTLGHHLGDQLLEQIAQRLVRPIRDDDTIARFGGDEFAILLPETSLDEALRLGRELIGTLGAPLRLHDLSLQIGASLGIAMFPYHAMDATELIQRADVAMYLAKRTRNELSVYDPEEDFSSLRHLTLNGELKQAIDQGDMTLYYQPKISCETGRLTGVEALVRWQHREHGLIPPGEFIHVAEHSGLIRPLSRWVLRSALEQCARWQRARMSIAVSVNLSARNLQEEDLPEALSGMLDESGTPPRLLTLEITESVLMENPKRAMAVLTEFSRLGVNISIDDYGTGYSSLAYLKRLPAREIKIDRGFVSEIDRNRDDAVIVRSSIEMAHNLGLSVVAEGVENEEVWRRLRAFGCNSAQGYFFSKPLPERGFERWLDSSPWKPGSKRDRRKPSVA